MAIFPGSAIPSAVSDYEIDNSLRFDAASSTKLTRTPTVAGNRKTWTISVWFKWSIQTQTYTQFFDGGGASGSECTFYLLAGSQLQWSYWDGAAEVERYKLLTTQLFRDPAAWYHFVAVQDTTQSVAADRLKIYLNGEQITAFATASYPTVDLECPVNNTSEHSIGSWQSGTGRYYSGYLAEFYLIDGTALTPSSFGELDSTTNQWIPLDSDDVKDAVTFGTNGFYLDFSNIGGQTQTAHRYWKYEAYSTSGSPGDHHPRVSRIYIIKEDGTYVNFDSASFTSDNCSDSGTIPAIGTTYTVDLTTANKAQGCGYYNVYGAGARTATSKLYYSDNNSDWTEIASQTITTNDGCGEYNLYIGGGLGKDTSGEGNNFAVRNLVSTDQMIDTPTNNFCTLNPLVPVPSSPTLTEGNLKGVYGSGWSGDFTTWMVESGKFYCEFLLNAITTNVKVGVMSINEDLSLTNPQDRSKSLWYNNEGTKFQGGGSPTAYGASYTAGDIVGIALDKDGNTLTFYKNGSSQGELDLTSFNVGTDSLIIGNAANNVTTTWNFGADSSFAGAKTAQGNQDDNGKGDFYYEPPSGYLALCTDNLSDPEIALPGENFNTVLYTGNGADRPGGALSQSLTVGLQPDFTWIKVRSHTGQHMLFDSIRGAGTFLHSDQDRAERTDATTFTSFDSDGFTVGTDANQYGTNYYNYTYVGWNWKAGGAPTVDNSAGAGATPTAGSVKIDGSNLGSALAGSIAATRLSANTTAGFSIVEYSGVDTPSTNTVAHGLSVTPELYIIKNMTSASPLGWIANTTVIDGTVDYLVLNTGAAAASQGSPWSTLPTASVFTLGANDGNTCNDGDDYIAYCFHSVEGYSKVGSYIGNGNTDGVFIYTGFKPAFIIGKNTTEADYAWWLVDTTRSPHNIVQKILSPQANSAETDASYEVVDIVSNGFKFRIPGTDGNLDTYNGTDDGYLYIAFASHPFKTSNAR